MVIIATTSKSGSFTSTYSTKTYNFVPPKSGYYEISFTSTNGYYLSVDLYEYSTNIIAAGTSQDNYNYGYTPFKIYKQIDATHFDTNFYLYEGHRYNLRVKNTSIALSYTVKIYRGDNNIVEHPQPYENVDYINSSIDYVGDADYYTFTNLGGFYNIYSSGYGNGNMDVKGELYLCSDSDCKTWVTNQIAVNDDHGILSGTDILTRLDLPEMGTCDFGFTVNLGWNNLGKKYITQLSQE